MLAKRIVACLDVKDGRVVKGIRFGHLRDAGDPAECARRYCDAGIDEIVVLDVSATLEGRAASHETVATIAREIDVPLTAGGGVRTEDDAIALLEAGADKVAVNSAAVHDPSILSRLAARYGAQCVVLSVDVRRTNAGYDVATRSGTHATGCDALEWVRQATDLGAGEILLTSIDRDGTRAGYDLEAVKRFGRALRVPLIASGGARDAASFGDALLAGADAALGASVFHDGDVRVAEVKRDCIARGLEVRL
ncbi:MAG TPA: HisA/HisF-related TIM barrel protein [Candidatus Acidoferrales bacterium]|nr:HisA/HisF-related TIM barrel protein [Candidatus Acidoferrales bacterium]